MNSVVALYKKYLADTGQQDDRTDLQITRELGDWARQDDPQLFNEHPDFAEQWGQLREANAPSLMEEGTRAFKRAGIGLGSTAVGGAALLTGSDYLKRKAAALSMQAADPALASTIPTLEDIRPGQDGAGQVFSRDALRYGISKVGEAVPSIGEAVALAGVGGLIGSAIEPGAGTVAGAATGAVEGILGRGIIRSAIKSLVQKGAAEEAIVAGLRKGAPEIVEAVTKTAKGLAGARAGTVTAALNSYLLNSGEVYGENDDRATAAGLGLISAIPDTVLPALVVRKMFPGVSLSVGREAAREVVGDNALKVAKAAGVTGFEGATESFQEAVNIVARNLKEGVDPFTITDDDKIRIREAGITGAVGGALASPAVVLERSPEEIVQQPPAPPAQPLPPAATAPLVPPTPAAPVLLPTQRARAMSPEQQVARLAELEVKARTADEEAEYQILRQIAPRAETPAAQPVVPEFTPETVAAVEQGNLPLAPTPTLPEPGPEATAPIVPNPTEASAPVPAFSEDPKLRQVQQAVAIPGITYQYTVFPKDMGGIVQIDVIGPDGKNLTSTNLPQLAQVGVNLPAVPESLPMGKYTPEQIQAASVQPSTPSLNASTITSAAPLGQFPGGQESTRTQGSQGVEPVFQGPETAGAQQQIPVAPPQGGQTVAGGIELPAISPAPAMRTGQPEITETERASKIARIKEINALAKPLSEKGELTREEASRFTALMSEANSLRFDVARPLALEKIPSPTERQSTLPSEIVLIARNDLMRDKDVYTPIIDAAIGVYHNADTAVDTIMRGQNATVSPQALYDAFSATREAMRQHYGNSVKLYRATGAQKSKPTTNWATTKEYAQQFGNKVESRDVPINDIIAVNVGPNGKYHEVIVGAAPSSVPAARTETPLSTDPTNPAVNAQRTQEFQAVMGRLVANGANVQLMSRELLVQQTGEALQQQIQALQQRLQQATTAPQRNELQRQIDVRTERLAEVEQMRGVTYSPYHIAIAMSDVMNASLDNLVTLLHEAAESLTMRLTPEQQGAVSRAVEAATAQMMAKMQAAAKNTGATVANVPNPGELLAETMAQTLAAEGISDAPSLAQAIVRWIKEIYYRTSMALQKAFGGEPDLELSLRWYENQLRRELGGDYEYSFARMLDRFLPQPNQNFASKFSGASQTPGGMVDFFDPTTQKLAQPWVEPLSDEALEWNMKFQTGGVNPGESDGIPAEEAVMRQTAAAYNEQIKWLTKLHDDIAPQMDMQAFLSLASRGEKTPQEMLDVLKSRLPGVETAEIGGERMTDAMNKWAAHQTLEFMKKVQEKHLSRIAQMQEAVKDADERFTEHASELNRLESDVRNAELHEGELKKKVRTLVEGVLKSYKNGIRTAAKLGSLQEMIENEENLGPLDPLPQFYEQVFNNLLNADVPLFDYIEAIALLDLPLGTMTPTEIWTAIRKNADTSEALRRLSRNKPLAMTLSVMARQSSRELDQIQLRKATPETFLTIHKELEGIRNATEAQLREMIRAMDEKSEAKGLRQRIKAAYLKERRALQRASDRLAQVEERIAILEKAKPAVAEKIGEMQQAIGGVFTDWQPGNNVEMVVMRRADDGSFQRATRKLVTNADGSYEDSAGIYDDLAQNNQWLKANVERAGQKEYQQVKQQTETMQLMDISRAYVAANYGKIMGFIDKFVRPLQAIAKQAGHASGARVVQQFNKYEFINRSAAKALTNLSYEWGTARSRVMESVGISDVGQFHTQIENPVKYFMDVNPGLDQAQAIRGAIKVAREHLAKPPAANFNERFEAFLLKDKALNDELRGLAESNGVLVWDEKLGELRKALPRGWNTSMRMMDDGTVVTLIHDMEKAGWKLDFDKDALAKNKKVVLRSMTFDALNPKNAKTEEERAEYYAQLENTEALRAALKPYFTPGILDRWLVPFINKPGEPVFSHDGRDISQIDLQNAWANAGGDVLNWIDNLGQAVGVTAEEGVSEAATFRWDMLRQLEHLFKWEAGMAYEAEQTPDLFTNNSTKLHVMMDARVNDLLPAEHVNYAQYDPTSVRQLVGQIAFHGAFGRNGQALNANLKELEAVSVAKKFAFDSLKATTVEGKRREAKQRGFDYDDLKRAVNHYHDVLELTGEIEAAFGAKNVYGPLYDARAGMELLGFMVGQVVDQPKTGALNFLSIGARPFAMHSFSPKVLKSTALSYGELARNTFGGLLRDFGIDLVRMSDYAKETGEVEGKAFRRLPFGTVISGDQGKNGSFQDSLSQRFLVQPLRIFKAIQRKGVGPGIAAIPGLGTMQRFSTDGAIANNRGQVFLLQEIINNGIRHFSTHPEDLNNPAFRFDQSSLKLRGDRGMYDWFRNKTVEYNMGPIEKIVRDAIARQAAGERTITTEMVEQLAQMNAQELDGASSINTAPAATYQNTALRIALPLLRWPLWMMHAAHEGLADANGRADFKSMMRGIGRLAAWNLPLGLAFTFMIDEYDEKILKKKNAMPQVSKLAAIPIAGVPLALATSPRSVPQELLGIGQRMIRTGNIYGLGADLAGTFITPFDPGSGQRAFSLDQRVLVMSQFLNLTQAISNMVSQGGTATWGSVYRPMVASIGGNGMLNSLDVVNNLLGLDNAESRLTTRINAARWVNTAAKELEIDVKKTSGYSSPTPMSVWTREMQLAAMANSRVDFMEAYRKALEAAREKVAEDNRIEPENKEKEAMQRVLSSWRSRNPFSGLASTPTPEQKAAMLRVMNDQGRADVQDAMRYYEAYTRLIAPSETDRFIDRRMRSVNPAQQMESMRRRAAGALMVQ